MRLRPDEVMEIKAAAAEAFGAETIVRLFGSRVHDHLRGGDIDLHFEVDGPLPPFRQTCRFLDLLEQPLDGRKVDTVFSVRGEERQPFDAIAYREWNPLVSDAEDGEALLALLAAMRDVRSAIADAREQLNDPGASAHVYAAMDTPRRLARLALLKSVEQLEDLIARTLRAALVYEQLDLTGLLPRAIADQAEKAGMIPSSDRWSDLVRLGNRRVHEYPLPVAQQWNRLVVAWHAAEELVVISEQLVGYLKKLNIEERP